MYIRDGEFVMFDCYGLGYGELRLVPVIEENKSYF